MCPKKNDELLRKTVDFPFLKISRKFSRLHGHIGAYNSPLNSFFFFFSIYFILETEHACAHAVRGGGEAEGEREL